MADKTQGSGARLDVPAKGLEWVTEHKLQVQVWLNGLTLFDREALVGLLQQHPLLTFQALREIVERKPR